MQKNIMKYIISVEYLVAAILVAVFYVAVGHFAWYWLPLLFFAVDITTVGYLVNPRTGAFIYNLGHSLIGPVILTLVYIATINQTILFVALIWLFHILVDRALGFGLKHTTSFHHTHLGPIGKKRQSLE